jgi:thioredoxin 1
MVCSRRRLSQTGTYHLVQVCRGVLYHKPTGDHRMATIDATRDNFEELIKGNDIILVDFWAPWCGPCRQFAPVYESLAEQHEDIVFAKVNTEEERELAGHFQIRSIPTLMVFREQIIVFSQPGALPPAALSSIIEKVRDLDMEMVRKEVEEQMASQQTQQT